MRDFREFTSWRNATDFAVEIYRLTERFPASEKFGLSSQMQRAAVSVPANIAEGASRASDAEFARFLEIALGSAFELETQLIIAGTLGYVPADERDATASKLASLQKQLNAFLSKLRPSRRPSTPDRQQLTANR